MEQLHQKNDASSFIVKMHLSVYSRIHPHKLRIYLQYLDNFDFYKFKRIDIILSQVYNNGYGGEFRKRISFF